MTWLENYILLMRAPKASIDFLDMLIGQWTADMYQIFKEKKYKLSTFDPFRQLYPIIKYFKSIWLK